MMSPADFDEIEHRLPFILTTEDLPKYNITYLGRQHVDELDTYVFSAGPKTLEKGKHYFQGKVWVDQQDFQIVLVNGKTVPQDTRKGHEDLQPPFTTYYEQIDGKYWFPTYTKAEGVLHFAGSDGTWRQDVHMRNIVKYTDYKQFRATSRIIYNGEDITNNKAPDDKDKWTRAGSPVPRCSHQRHLSRGGYCWGGGNNNGANTAAATGATQRTDRNSQAVASTTATSQTVGVDAYQQCVNGIKGLEYVHFRRPVR